MQTLKTMVVMVVVALATMAVLRGLGMSQEGASVLAQFTGLAALGVCVALRDQKHAHDTRHGTVERNHWFNVYKCPVCGRLAGRKRQPIICRGD